MFSGCAALEQFRLARTSRPAKIVSDQSVKLEVERAEEILQFPDDIPFYLRVFASFARM